MNQRQLIDATISFKQVRCRLTGSLSIPAIRAKIFIDERRPLRALLRPPHMSKAEMTNRPANAAEAVHGIAEGGKTLEG